MSSKPCRYADKCSRQNCPFFHEPVFTTDESNVTYSKPPSKNVTTTHRDCKFDIYCQRSNCSFIHPNGRIIDYNTSSPLDNTQQITDSSLISFPSSFPSEYGTRQRHDSIQSDSSSWSNSCTSSITSNTRVPMCRLGIHCRRKDCYFIHPYGRDIDQISTFTNNIKSENYQPSNTELIEKIKGLLSKTDEQLQEFDMNEKESGDSDDEPILDMCQEQALKELHVQKKEFDSAINRLTAEFSSIASSTVFNSYDELRLRQIQQQLERELKRWQSRLPIYAKRSDIIEKLKRNQVLILKADTGSGKSTQIVQYLCDEHFADQKQIICTQPRKLAVRSLSARVAEEYGCRVGEEIGFQVGGGRPNVSHKTKVKFVTDTLFLHEYQNDPMLRKYSIVIVDEAHERKIDTDIVFGIMKRCLRKRTDLKLVIMSATLDMNLLYKYFAHDFQCDTLEVGGRIYPIEDIYLDEDIDNYVQISVTKAVEIHKSDELGDILVFLTGQDEIDLALAELNQKLENDKTYLGLPLHGKLSEEENARIFEKIPNVRKIIFSTNVAETSVTIDGIKHVIESGMVKEKMWDEKRKMQILKIGEITKSSVKQRRGRAGRTSAGKCYHLYTIETYEAMDACSRAEILCTQPTLAVLKLKHLDIDNIESFEWLESPSESSLREAYQTLVWLNALNTKGKLTTLGRNMARLDIDPKLAAMLYKGQELNCLSYTLILAGMLTVSQNIWWSSKDEKSKEMAAQSRVQLSHESGDHITFIIIYIKWTKFCMKHKSKKQQYEWYKNNSINGKSLQMAQDFIREKTRQMDYHLDLAQLDEQINDDLVQRILLCVTAGHFMNLAVSNGPLRAGYQVISAFSPMTQEPLIARVFRTSTLCLNEQMPTYILYNELLNLNQTNYITVLSSIDLNWLESASQHWYTTINGANLHTISYESYTIENVGVTLLRAIVGKRNCHLNKLEELTQSIIDLDYKQAKIIIWSRKANLDNAKTILEKMIAIEKQKLLTEAEEIRVLGRTRILMSAGGISQMVLIEDEFIRIIITKLPSTVTEERIRDICLPYGQIRKIDFIRQNDRGCCVAVTYTTIEEARAALSGLNGLIERENEIVVTSSSLKTEATESKQNCRLKAIWYLTMSTGNGRIVFSDEKDALEAQKLFTRLYYDCHYERLTNFPTLKITYYLAENSGRAFINFETNQQALNAIQRMNDDLRITLARAANNRTGSIMFQAFPKEFDEEDVRNHFRGCPGLTNVQVLRGRRGRRYLRSDSAEDDIKTIFDNYESFQPNTITFNSNIMNGKLEAYAEFLNIQDLKQAIEDLDGKIGLLGCGKLRLAERIRNKKSNTRQNKENEYIVKIQGLNRAYDKYDLIKTLKEHQLYDHVKNVTVYRQKLDDNRSTDLWSNNDTASVDQDIGLIRLRSMFINTGGLFHTEPDCYISSSTPDGIVTATVLFKDPVDVLTAIQTYDNQEIQLSRRASKLRLTPSISHEIFINAALTRAMPEKIEQVIQRIRDNFKRIRIKSISAQSTEKATTMKIFIDGDDIEQITRAKIEFDNLMKGIEYKYEDDSEKTKILFDRSAATVVQRIEKETGCYIWSNFSNFVIRMYGGDKALANAKNRLDRYIREIFKNKKHTVTLDIPSGCVRQVLKISSTYQETIGKQFHVEISILIFKRQVRLTGKEEDVIKCEQVIKDNWSKIPVEKQPSKKATATSIVECPICYNSANYSLQACGHAYCLDCLRQQLSTKFDTTLSNESFKIKCMMSQCDLPFLLRDIKTIMDSTNMPKLVRASFQAYLKSDQDLVQCMGIDCNQVYRKSKHPQSYVCDSCLKMYCVKCEVEYHMGLTCDAYQTLLKWRVEEPTTMFNIGNLDLKPCPACKQVIERYDGCNAVKCKCGISFCWLCLQTDPVDIHPHYTDPTSKCFNKCFARA